MKQIVLILAVVMVLAAANLGSTMGYGKGNLGIWEANTNYECRKAERLLEIDAKLDTIIAKQRQIMDDVSHNRQMVDRIFYLMTARESLAAEQF